MASGWFGPPSLAETSGLDHHFDHHWGLFGAVRLRSLSFRMPFDLRRRTQADAREPAADGWGSRGRRFRSCHLDCKRAGQGPYPEIRGAPDGILTTGLTTIGPSAAPYQSPTTVPPDGTPPAGRAVGGAESRPATRAWGAPSSAFTLVAIRVVERALGQRRLAFRCDASRRAARQSSACPDVKGSCNGPQRRPAGTRHPLREVCHVDLELLECRSGNP
jgi:hypothetical protein